MAKSGLRVLLREPRKSTAAAMMSRGVVDFERPVMIPNEDVKGVGEDASKAVRGSFQLLGRPFIARLVKSGHRALREIASLGDRPLVVDFDQHRARRSQRRAGASSPCRHSSGMRCAPTARASYRSACWPGRAGTTISGA